MDLEIEYKREQIRQSTLVFINDLEEEARVKIELVRITVVTHIDTETTNLWLWADLEINNVREEVHLYVQHYTLTLRAEAEEQIIAVRLEIDAMVAVTIEALRVDALLKIEAYKVKIMAEIDSVTAEFLLQYQDHIVIETQIAIDLIETYYIGIYFDTETRIILEHNIKVEELHIFWTHRLEVETTEIINYYNV